MIRSLYLLGAGRRETLGTRLLYMFAWCLVYATVFNFCPSGNRLLWSPVPVGHNARLVLSWHFVTHLESFRFLFIRLRPARKFKNKVLFCDHIPLLIGFQVGPINHKRTLAFLNHFITHSVRFLNRFSCVCEEVSLAVISLFIVDILHLSHAIKSGVW